MKSTLCRFAHIWLRLHRIRHNSFSTRLLFWIKEARQRSDSGLRIGNQESRAPLITSVSNHFTSNEILHDISHYPFDFTRLNRIDRHCFSRDAANEAEGTFGGVRHAASVHFPIRKIAANDFAPWLIYKLPGQC